MTYLKECDRVHEFCNKMSDCPYCGYAYPFRYENGRFTPRPPELVSMEMEHDRRIDEELAEASRVMYGT